MVRRPARHPYERGPLDGAAGRGAGGLAAQHPGRGVGHRRRGDARMSRLPEQPGERIERSKTIAFRFDGKKVEAYEGDTIGSALYASGQRTFSRSFKYHRRRGLMCCAGQCPNCLVAVDGAPGVRACTEPVRQGIDVQHMNAKPGLEFAGFARPATPPAPSPPPGSSYKPSTP